MLHHNFFKPRAFVSFSFEIEKQTFLWARINAILFVFLCCYNAIVLENSRIGLEKILEKFLFLLLINSYEP